ncbi:hypothetical protein POM88_015906 [Heracleum sosnowskyi]|uniref:Uncharacterized protein n=1 Tax=Heracleum sosnowskyi TaxID=360622 RepID=A0AAD8IM95_9APIA|nr:hypothetical protein POM88_015906 [Heracleum sosnowskyi]
MYRPISGPIHIDSEGDADQNQNNAENIVIATANQNEENQDVAELETVNGDVEDMIIGKQKEVTNNSDDDFVNPAPWSKSKGKQKNVTVREEVTNDSDDDFVNPAPWTKMMEVQTKKKEKKTKDKEEGILRLIDKETDEDVSEAQRLHDKEARLTGKRKSSKKSNEDDKAQKRRGQQKIEERTEIAKKAVHDVLGLPCRGAEIKFAKDGLRSKRTIEWRSQFPGNNELQSLIKASEVVDITKQTGHVDEIFKMDFLVVMTNVLIRSNTNNFVSQKILSMDDEFDNCLKYNWAAYLIKSLVITKRRWMHTASLFYTGPMIFLLILYVDQVCCQGKHLVPRRYPTFRGWTKEKLKERELLEAEEEEEAFGSGNILKMVIVEELEANEKLVWKVITVNILKDHSKNPYAFMYKRNLFPPIGKTEEEKGGAEIEKGVEDDNRQNPDGPHDDRWKDLNMKVVFLIDANIQLTEAKTEYEAQLANAKKLHPIDKRTLETKKRIRDLFKANKWMDSESYEDSFRDNENINIFPSQEEEAVVNTIVDAVEEAELPPYHDDYLDIIAWLKSPEGMLEIENDFQNQFIPSFSLGISQVCNKVMEEHDIDDYNKEGDDNRTPLPPKEPENKTKRKRSK